MELQEDYVEKVYAGWLGKVIGVRHGGNVENWTYERIQRTFGEVTGYLHTFKNFAADDDTNGPVFFLRALEDYSYGKELTAEQIGWTWLNYVPDGHGFFWWGGYGKSSEHTAYQNLKYGIPAPRSGSIEQNGLTVAEQIGGQIFIDVWGLIAPGRPLLAAEYAEKAAGVSHDGNGKFGGMFIAACIAAAFAEDRIHAVIERGLSVIPQDCRYARMVRDVVAFHQSHPENWRDAFHFVKSGYGYDKYPGHCHIIPNSAVIVLSLLYGQGDFSRSINICNMCGWDTDCNVANVGTIVGVMRGLAGIDEAWRRPINDFLCCSSVIGSHNMDDIPRIASYTARFGYLIAGQTPPERWAAILAGEAPRFHFEYPGSTHAFRVESDAPLHVTGRVENAVDAAASGERSLKVMFDKTRGGYAYRVYHQTYYRPEHFDDSRYDPSFSPLLYPGQTVEARVMAPDSVGFPLLARLYIKDGHTGRYFYGEKVRLVPDKWTALAYRIPRLENVCIEQAGVEWIPVEAGGSKGASLIGYIDDMHFRGEPDYAVDFGNERLEQWNDLHVEVSQMSYLRGIWTLEHGELSGSCHGETAECYTGDPAWADYTFEAVVIPKLGDHHRISFRVQGAIRSYAAGLAPNGKIALYKNDNGYALLREVDGPWQAERAVLLKAVVRGNRIRLFADDKEIMDYTDEDRPYLRGMIGFSNTAGSHTHYKRFAVGR